MITGATSGFGAATARRFAKAGWRVIADRPPSGSIEDAGCGIASG
jgi:NAD(P)-dependent dehydrogenase (short-subunit alcohol dehydrogenase family)